MPQRHIVTPEVDRALERRKAGVIVATAARLTFAWPSDNLIYVGDEQRTRVDLKDQNKDGDACLFGDRLIAFPESLANAVDGDSSTSIYGCRGVCLHLEPE